MNLCKQVLIKRLEQNIFVLDPNWAIYVQNKLLRKVCSFLEKLLETYIYIAPQACYMMINF